MQVAPAVRSPGLHRFTHWGGGSDWVDERNITQSIRHLGSYSVAVSGLHGGLDRAAAAAELLLCRK
jgi:hypothetical protein